MNPQRALVSLALFLASSSAWAKSDAAGGHGEIPWQEIGFHALNLTILLGVLGFLLGRKVKDALGARALTVRRDIDDSENARNEAKKRFVDVEARLADFDNRLAAMKAEAEENAQAERAVVLARAERDVALIKRTAEHTIKDEVRRARQTLREDAVSLSVQLAEERLKGALQPADHSRLNSEFLGAVNGAPKQEVNHG
jgi:F-type H+-transporting ATPase subunit b